MSKRNHWRPPATAPRDGTVVLADFGWPWVVSAVWSAATAKWVYAQPAAEELDDGAFDWYFENEWEPGPALRRWMPMPELSPMPEP